MTAARRTLISLDDTPYYHCVARCVRRAFLCGEDHYSGQNFDHRRQWVVDRLKFEASIFAIDICAYAIMSNHYHVVVRVDRDRAARWTDGEVIERWCRLFRGPLLIQAYLAGSELCEAKLNTIKDITRVWRQRLTNISWFMRCLNEFIARQANLEDQCTGRFWEGRFKSQALLDNRALLSCMAYVDLNPVRAGIASDLMGSQFTSIRERLRENSLSGKTKTDSTWTASLLQFSEKQRDGATSVAIPVSLTTYIDLVDWTGRVVREDQLSAISLRAPPALAGLGLSSGQWLDLCLRVQRLSLQAIGNSQAMRNYNSTLGRHWVCGQSYLGKIYADG